MYARPGSSQVKFGQMSSKVTLLRPILMDMKVIVIQKHSIAWRNRNSKIYSQRKRRNKRVFNYCQTKECFTTVKQVFFSYTTEGYYSEQPDLLALYLSGTPSLMTGTRPSSCLHLDNGLYIIVLIKLPPKFDMFNPTKTPCLGNETGPNQSC